MIVLFIWNSLLKTLREYNYIIAIHQGVLNNIFWQICDVVRQYHAIFYGNFANIQMYNKEQYVYRVFCKQLYKNTKWILL